MLREAEEAVVRGADVVGICWYPIVDCPPWRHPRFSKRWRHGLIREDLDVDPILSAALREGRPQTTKHQLVFDWAS